ncbi:g4233 [Coccomyxa elongata]
MSSPKDAVLQKARQMQDKNKRAQQRYRVRQKEKTQDYKKQLDELSNKVEQLMQEKASLEKGTELLEKVVRMKDEEIENAQENTEEALPYQNDEMRAAIHAVNEIVYCSDNPMTMDELRTVGASQIEAFHKRMVTFLALQLTKPDVGEAGSPTSELVIKVVNLVRTIKMMFLRLNYPFMRRTELAFGHLRVPPHDHPAWTKAVANAGITSEQRQLLLASHSLLLERMDTIMKNRKAIVSAVTSALRQKGTPTVMEAAREGGSECYGELSKVSAALQANLAQEQQAFIDFYEEVQTEQSPLKQLQEAQILVEIFPHRFESLWLCSVLAMEEKQEHAKELSRPQHGLGHFTGTPGARLSAPADPPATSDPPATAASPPITEPPEHGPPGVPP